MRKTIIIAENIREALGGERMLLGRGGLAVLGAQTCEEMLALYRDRGADLLITDSAQPAIGGARLCAAVRADLQLRDVSIIILCDPDGNSMLEAQQAGANAVIRKPLDPGELFAKISHLLLVHERMSVRVPLRITVNVRGTVVPFVGISRDISISGMLLEAGTPLQPGQRLECTFPVMSRIVEVECVVVRTHASAAGTPQYGVKFMNLDAKNFILLENFIRTADRS